MYRLTLYQYDTKYIERFPIVRAGGVHDMIVDRRRVFLIPFMTLGSLRSETSIAGGSHGFEPVAIAKLRAGEVAREITESGRDPGAPDVSSEAVFNTGLLLQAGLRALLPIEQRQDVALPGSPSTKDTRELVDAQQNYAAVFKSGAEATPPQREAALSAVRLAAQQLHAQGYQKLSKAISDWLAQQ
jgi:hypothetical protein